MSQDLYAALGIDAAKEGVRKVFSRVIDNDFPGAFVNIVRDPEFPGMVFTGHMDGDGSKFIQRILMFRETGGECPEIFRGAADDALSMNTGDIAAAGFTSGVMTVTDIINVNGFNVPKQIIMEQIGSRLAELVDLYRRYGFKMYFLGGETADLPDQVQTIAFDVNVHARAKEEHIIKGNVRPGDRIWGFESNGQAAWESVPNSGIMSNGLTLARTVLMDEKYTGRYPDLVRVGGKYRGVFLPVAYSGHLEGMTVGDALTSPTRQWAILIKMIMDELHDCDLFHLLHGITMNTGGGATKVLHLGNGGICYRKCMPDPAEIFKLVQYHSEESWRNMFRNFNCGVGLDVIGHENLGPILKRVSEKAQINLYELGHCEIWGNEKNHVILDTPYGRFDDY